MDEYYKREAEVKKELALLYEDCRSKMAHDKMDKAVERGMDFMRASDKFLKSEGYWTRLRRHRVALADWKMKMNILTDEMNRLEQINKRQQALVSKERSKALALWAKQYNSKHREYVRAQNKLQQQAVLWEDGKRYEVAADALYKKWMEDSRLLNEDKQSITTTYDNKKCDETHKNIEERERVWMKIQALGKKPLFRQQE